MNSFFTFGDGKDGIKTGQGGTHTADPAVMCRISLFLSPPGLKCRRYPPKSTSAGKKDYQLPSCPGDGVEPERRGPGTLRAGLGTESPHFFRVEFFSCYPEKGAQPNQVIVSDGNKICLFSPEMGDYFALNPSFERIAPTPFLLNTFYSGLAKSQESEFLGIEKKEKNVYYLLRIVPPVPQKDRAYEEIWLERRTLLPVQILTYDEQEQVQQRVLFHKTVLNTVISEELFKIDEKGGAASQ